MMSTSVPASSKPKASGISIMLASVVRPNLVRIKIRLRIGRRRIRFIGFGELGFRTCA